ncbi:MAG: LamG domain-containing protein [Deltaproteobacteria bacterium]|nr:LamG domain-containing protein [Deltaproteobacteria bacterium]
MFVKNQAAVLAIALCLFIGSGISYAELSDGLISAWTFDDGSAKDCVGNNDGEILGGVEVIEGKFKKALSFNGKDGFVQIQHDKSIEVIEESYTVSAWIKPRAGVNGNAGIVTKGEGSGWGIKYAFKITIDWWGVSNKSTEGYFHAAGALNRPGEWVFACLTADGTGAIGHAAGEDGKVEIRACGEGNPHPIAGPYLTEPDFPIEIGVARKAGGTTDAFFDGIIDEVYLWDRALSEDELAFLAKGARPEFISPVEPGGKLSTLWGLIMYRRYYE